ncbi:biotin/lipoate--protein ligase family protein [Rhodovulum sp. P5]|uniref:biotin/lipoate--protein ligase family protein n=1 Tax=Rhodovulum sp. P5 TaxID=1564506 RepID=UPI0020A2BC10|nr:biotin/lipoate--protein ligase family protein [Rhodovulum sp. P5]
MSDAAPNLPPLMSGEGTPGDPFAVAVARARAGTEAGLIVHNVTPDHLSAALVLAPEVPLAEAMAMVLAVANGFADAFGALAPSEVAAQFDWPGGFRINGGQCGGIRAAASTTAPGKVPGWLVLGLDVPFRAPADREPGEDPERTTLDEEGCGDICPVRLVESWARHTLFWIHDWQEGGPARLHDHWCGRAFALGRDVTLTAGGERRSGRAIGLDEQGGLLLRLGDDTRILPLTEMLEPLPC